MNNLVLYKSYYSKIIFSIYDQILLKYALPFIWKCKVADIEKFYETHMTSNHLDIGSGTGYFIDSCRRLPDNSSLTIMDINPVCLKICEKKLQRFNLKAYKHDILMPITSVEKYNSIGLNLLLHCLPGDMKAKEVVFRNIKNILKPGGTVFGTTFILKNTQMSILSRIWGYYFNKSGLLSNDADSIEGLKNILARNFQKYDIAMVGHCAFFTAANIIR